LFDIQVVAIAMSAVLVTAEHDCPASHYGCSWCL